MSSEEFPLRLVCLSRDAVLERALDAALAPFGDAVQLTLTDPEAPDEDTLAGAHVLLCGALSLQTRARAHSLRWVQFWTIGVDGRLAPELFANDVQVATASDLHVAACAEHVLALMLAFARGLPQAFAAQRAHDGFAGSALQASLFAMEGKTVGIVGAGRIGQAVGVRCQAFGMHTIGLRRNLSRGARGIDVLLPHLRYHDLVLASDFIVLALPLTPDTRLIFGEDEIEICKKSAHVFNIGRGGLIDERWLLRALENRWIAGAGLALFADEPLAPDSPFWDLPNCILTPHSGLITPRYWERFARLVADQVGRRQNGEPLANLVDKNRGY